MTELQTILDRMTHGLEAPSESWRSRARARLDTLTKPLGSLGRLEDIAAQVVAIRQHRSEDPLQRAVYVFAADHGVTAAGVSAYPREVTHQMVLNFLAEGAAINVLARLHKAELHVVDVGVDADFEPHPRLIASKIARGSRNMIHEPAMSLEELTQAFAVGESVATRAAASGTNIIAIGEMGIGNTTAASAITCAITCALTHSSAHLATGRGTGVDSAAHQRKINIVESALALHQDRSPTEILRCVGGLEIASMTAAIITAAREKLVVLIDGFISTASAALAVALAPQVRGYLIAGHRSQEPGHRLLLDHLQLEPILTLEMRLGEGTGAVLAMPIVDSAVALYWQMATFASAGVSEKPL
jgi:nicotinate-nucleotide--dimethylbenzimidazole phosphoribosyltransferase